MVESIKENIRTVQVFPGATRADDYTEDDTSPTQPTRTIVTQPADEPSEIETLTHVDETPATSPVVSIFDNPAAGLTAAAHTPATPVATTGFRGLLARMGVRVAPSPAELDALERADARRRDETVVRQATWTRAVSVLVANPKGGTGKTPSALILGGILASIRGGSVAVVEVADDPGALTFRAEGNPALGLGDLMRDVDQISNAGQLAGYTAPQTSFAAVIGSTGRRPRLTGEAVVDIAHVIDEFYTIRVMDSGNQPTSSAFQGAVAVADVLVIPVMNAGDSTLEAIRLLDELRAAGGTAKALADTAIAIRLIDGRPENTAVTDEVTRLLTEAGISHIHDIPYDRHIAERGQITLATLTPATAAAFTSAAATIVKTLQTSAQSTHTTRKVSA